jgi:hypothetical protein
MSGLKFDDSLVELLASTAFEAPSIFDISNPPIISNDIVKRLVEVHMDEAIDFIMSLGIKPLLASFLAEDIYALCNENSLLFIGRFLGGLVPATYIYKYRALFRSNLFLHSHPVPLPIPSPEDIVSATQIGYDVECVVRKISSRRAMLTCIEPFTDWSKVIASYDNIVEKVLSVARYVVTIDGSDMKFLPMPSVDEVFSLLSSFKKVLEPYAKVLYVDIDLSKKAFIY